MLRGANVHPIHTCYDDHVREAIRYEHRRWHLTMLDGEGRLDNVARRPLFGWLRGKRNKASDTNSSSPRNTQRQDQSLNPPIPDAAETQGTKAWDRILPAPVSTVALTAPVSTCSGSTLSRAASWSEATVGSESGMIVFGRLHSSEGTQDQATAEPPRSVEHRMPEEHSMALSFTPAARPIDIPFRLNQTEPNTALREVRVRGRIRCFSETFSFESIYLSRKCCTTPLLIERRLRTRHSMAPWP